MIAPDLPLLDLHRHIDGAVRPETVFDLRRQHGLPLPVADPAAFRRFVQVSGPEPGLLAFLEKFDWIVAALADYEACYRIAFENLEDARQEGLDYVELRFSPWFMAQAHGLDPAGVTEAVVQGARDGSRATGVGMNLIGIISRTYGPEIGHRELAALLTQRTHITALDLAGDEIHYPAELFVEHFGRARAAGWRVTVHAGEAAGPESVWTALRLLGAERIGHGVHAIEDPALVAHLAERGIPLEMSLTSNVQTSTVPSYAAHPARQFLAAGVAVTLNSDDPGISGITLPYEYHVAAPAAGLSPEQIRQAQRNALDAAFLSADAKQRLLARRNPVT